MEPVGYWPTFLKEKYFLSENKHCIFEWIMAPASYGIWVQAGRKSGCREED